jgi:Protein of unknown function (DUF4238)
MLSFPLRNIWGNYNYLRDGVCSSPMSTTAQRQSQQTNINHFVSQFTSRPWLMGTNHFCKLSKDKAGVQCAPVGPKNWGSERNLYSQGVEDALANIESKLAHLQRKLECSSELTSDDRYAWTMWLLASYLRTPTAFLCSAEVSAVMNNSADLFHASYAMLARCVTNPHCIELIANRDWEILTCDKPYFLKPDSGVILTDRLDSEDCLILYPLSPVSCWVATGSGHQFGRASVPYSRVFELNEHILRWSDGSVACTTQFWGERTSMLRDAINRNLASGQYSPPTSGRFFSIGAVQCDGEIRATILAPRGPAVMTVPESTIRPIGGVKRPTIPGLYDVEDAPSIAIGVRYSDDESEIDYGAAAQVMMNIGQVDWAVTFARKALQRDKNDLLSKLVVLASEPNADVGELIPKKADDAAELAIWWAMAKHQPLEGLKITSTWLKGQPDHKRLTQANFLCAVLVYGARLFEALCGKADRLPYLDDNTPLPDGVVELVKKTYSHLGAGVVSEVQDQIGKIDLRASGLASDIQRICGVDQKVRLYRKA